MAGLELAVSTVARPNPLVIAWRWRYEIGLGVLVALAVIGLNFAVGLWWGLATIVTASCLTAAWPAARKHVVIRAWCVITPHRVRTGCAQAWIHSRRGKIPVVLCTTAEPFGERVYLWCRAGSPRKIWLRPVRYWPRLAGPRLSMSPAMTASRTWWCST